MDEKSFRCNSKGKNMETKTPQNLGTASDAGINYQRYLFEFGSDEELYSISFRGNIPPEEFKKMLKLAQKCLYENMAENIRTYLEQHHLEYSDFITKKMPLKHKTVISHTNNLLHLISCDVIDEQIGDTDIYYGIMDHQQWIRNYYCEGCYSVIKRISSKQKETYEYQIIAQTFNYDETNGEEQSYFAIRTNNGNRFFHNIDIVEGKSVIPTFGSVNMIGLLLNIDNITTSEQTEKIAMK